MGAVLRRGRQPVQGKASGVIAKYVERLARELDFDPPLARRVLREVEDHLREAAAADPVGGAEAERRAVAAFGDPGALAAQFAVVATAKQARRAGAAAVLLVAAVFAAMKARQTCYGGTALPVLDELQALAAVVLSVDSHAFALSGIAAIASWIYIDSSGIP